MRVEFIEYREFQIPKLKEEFILQQLLLQYCLKLKK